MAAQSDNRCPLCDSQLTREVYERVLRIREARDKVFNKERDELVARMKAAEEGSASRVRRAADAARTEAEATATKAMAALQKQLQRLQAEATADRQRFQRELATEVRRAQGEARKGAAADLKKRDSEYRTAITKADKSIEHLTRQLDAQRREAEKTVEQRERAAQRLEKERARRQIDGLKNELKVMDERRKREEAEWKRTIEALKLKADGRDARTSGPRARSSSSPRSRPSSQPTSLSIGAREVTSFTPLSAAASP